jgi:hypothetical protein
LEDFIEPICKQLELAGSTGKIPVILARTIRALTVNVSTATCVENRMKSRDILCLCLLPQLMRTLFNSTNNNEQRNEDQQVIVPTTSVPVSASVSQTTNQSSNNISTNANTPTGVIKSSIANITSPSRLSTPRKPPKQQLNNISTSKSINNNDTLDSSVPEVVFNMLLGE